MTNYTELEIVNNRNPKLYRWILLAVVYVFAIAAVFVMWNKVYKNNSHYPETKNDVPDFLYNRPLLYVQSINNTANIRNQNILIEMPNGIAETMSFKNSTNEMYLVCYYSSSEVNATSGARLSDFDANLCTHINIGLADVQNSSIVLSENLIKVLTEDVPILRDHNHDVNLMLWIGGGDSGSGFSEMVRNHASRKIFIRSIKNVLRTYRLDGIDLDWEFPSAYNKERMHFSQLLYEIKQEYKREARNYLLSVAVAAPEGIAFFAYDVRQLNLYADYVNLMTYDYHFYTRRTPFTGLNAPLYARHTEHSVLSTLNINYSVNWWLSNGLSSEKLVVGLPTYGHTFSLVNPFNTAIGAPAEGYGHCGTKGFATYSEICWFQNHNLFISNFFDDESCSPYLHKGTEWISYETSKSIECKAKYVKSKNLGGIMAFSINTDDYEGYCSSQNMTNVQYPLIKTIKQILES